MFIRCVTCNLVGIRVRRPSLVALLRRVGGYVCRACRA